MWEGRTPTARAWSFAPRPCLWVWFLGCLLLLGGASGKKAEDHVIKDVSGKHLEKLLDSAEYVAVFYYSKKCANCDDVLHELETIDDDTHEFGLEFVKVGDKKVAKHYGITTFPALQYFRNREPITYDGDLMDEDRVLKFLTSLDAMELPDQIEEVNAIIMQRIVEENDFVAVLFCHEETTCDADPNERGCSMCEKALKELENIDDEADQLGIAFVKINDEDLADEYSLDKLPSLVYYRKQIPIVYDGDLTDEESVLEWLVRNKNTGDEDDVIEEITARTLNTLIHSVNNLVVLFYDNDDSKSMKVLEELERIDDDCDSKGMQFVKIDDDSVAKEYGIDELPSLVYFENQIPSLYDGDLMEEEQVLDWLLSQLVTDEIEDVTDEMLDRLIAKKPNLAVLFYQPREKESMRVLKDLETIDDDCDKAGIAFVKISDQDEAKEYGIETIPSMVYFENGIPNLYDGDLSDEDAVLEWLIHQSESDEIEDVTDEMLDMLIERSKHLAVLFYDDEDKKSKKVLNELENIDDECDQHGIVFVKIDNQEEAEEYGIENIPSLVYFEDGIPSLYEGDLMREEKVLDWLINQVETDEIEDVTDEMLDKLIEQRQFLAVLFYDKDDKQDRSILMELENIDDECDANGIAFVKIDNDEEAKEYGIEDLPTLVYFENGIPSIYEGDLSHEEEVLEWLIKQKNEDTIEEVTDEMLEEMIKKYTYIAVYFTGEECDEGEECYRILQELENIDDETDESGLHFVTTDELELAEEYGVDSFPAIVLFRNGDPLIYEGRLDDEDEVLAWLTDSDNLEIEDQIEAVNAKMLSKLIENEEHLAVLFYVEGEKRSEKVLHELENIDDECEATDIDFVRIADTKAAKEYGLSLLPAMIFFTRKFPQVYEGDLTQEEKVLEWLLERKGATPKNDVIDLVDRKQLQRLIDDYENTAVFFYEKACRKECEEILEGLETIDDDAEEQGIRFVKIPDVDFAKQIGITEFPSLVYFEEKIPSIFDGDLLDYEAILDWLVYQKVEDTIENINREMLDNLIKTQEFLAVFFYIEDNQDCVRSLKKMETIDDEATEFGITIVKMNDNLMAKKYGIRRPPGIVYFRKGKHIKYDGDIMDQEEVLEWLTDPDNMELTDHIEKVNRKMFEKIKERADYLAVFFYSDSKCKQCEKVLNEIENIDDEAANAGIEFVKVDDPRLAKEHGVHALPALLYFRRGSEEPIIYAGDLKNEERILEWLLAEKDPSGDIIEDMSGDKLRKLISKSESVAVYFYSEESCDDCAHILEELENIDDDTDRHGISFVKTQDLDIAESYGVREFPALVYFEKGQPSVYEGDLSAEEDVLHWLVTQRTEDTIETVNREMLAGMIEDTQYLAVFFYKQNCKACESVLNELENIDDECDLYGIHMVKINDPQLAKRYGIKTFPALVYFRNGNPLIFDGDLKNEEGLLEWLIDDDNRELEGEIEEVNGRMFERLLDESPFLAVLFYENDCELSKAVLEELENIDEEADTYGIDFVKISDEEVAHKFGIIQIPSLVYFRKRTPLIYDGDLTDEDRVLQWLTSQDVFEIKDEIEEVNRKMLEKLLDENDFVSVFFYDNNCPKCDEALKELEHIDDETDDLDITFVKIKDARYAKKYGITKVPALVYFRKRFPSIYRGDLTEEEEVLDWLQKNRFKHPELNLFMYGLAAISIAFVMYTLFLMFCFKQTPPTSSTTTNLASSSGHQKTS